MPQWSPLLAHPLDALERRRILDTSIGKLFIAGIIPGLLGVILYLVAVRYTIIRNPKAGPAGERSSPMDRLHALRGVWAVLLLFFIVIGGLYGVLNIWPLNLTFSPTEAAGMGAAGAFLIAVSRGKLNFSKTLQVLIETVQTTAALFAVLIGAWIFSNFVNMAGLPEALRFLVSSAELSPMLVMLMILGIYLVLGCVFESLSMLLLTVPIFFPLVSSLGFDPIRLAHCDCFYSTSCFWVFQYFVSLSSRRIYILLRHF